MVPTNGPLSPPYNAPILKAVDSVNAVLVCKRVFMVSIGWLNKMPHAPAILPHMKLSVLDVIYLYILQPLICIKFHFFFEFISV